MEETPADKRLQQVANGVYRFDTGYIRPRHTACYIIRAEDRVAIVDCGVNATIEPLLEAVETLGVTRHAIESLIATHAHLDHAGGGGRLMAAIPQATLYAHPSATRHLIDPGKLEKGVRAVYGDTFFDREYGALEPVSSERVVATPDQTTLKLGQRVLDVVHTPGHARHHQAIRDRQTSVVFAGDAFGVGYPELDGPEGRLFVPETPPNQFDPEAMHASIDRILALTPARILPTHYGNVDKPASVAYQLHRFVDAYVECCMQADSLESLQQAIMKLYEQELRRRGRRDDIPLMRDYYSMDTNLVAQGLWDWRLKDARQR